MRAVTSQIVQAWRQGVSKTVGNTRTDGERIWLHGNCIAKRDGISVYITSAGYNTLTTRERLNGILYYLGIPVNIIQHKHNLYYCVNDARIPWDGEWLMVR